MIFKIIRDEGGSGDAGLVINDCLRICSNLLHNSETCQRLFFAMGTEWIRQLAEFFNPAALENPDKIKSHLVDAEHAMEQFCWFEESSRLSCAILAMTALAHALDPVNIKHQNTVLNNSSVVISHAAFWVARGGPSELVSAAMSVLLLVCRDNVQVAQTIATTIFVKVSPASKGKNVPTAAETSPLLFGWRASPQDDSRYVSPLSLFGERYLHPVSPWDPPSGRCFDGDLEIALRIGSEDMTLDFQLGCLQVFSAILSADTSVPDIMIQFVLAPPPPPMMDTDEDDSFGNGQMVMETMKPIAGILVNMVAQVCERTLSANHMYTGVSAASFKTDLDVGERALHLLSIVFLNASQLGRELITAISSVHLQNLSGMQEKGRNMHDHHEHKQILSFFLASAGKAARVPGGGGYHFLTCLLQLLAVIASGCERAVAQMFDDPANLFVVDLATSSSELAGVPAPVQLSVCFFLGCCFTALPKDKKDSEADSGSILQRKTFLAMIDSKVGLNRFTEILKRPAMVAKKQHTDICNLHQYGNYFAAIDSFKDFFLTQAEAIKIAIFELYSGVDTSDGTDSVHQQVILMQQEKIKELEGKLASSQHGIDAVAAHPEGMILVDKHEVERLKVEVANKTTMLDEANGKTKGIEKQLEAAMSETDSVRLYLQEVEKENSAVKNSNVALLKNLEEQTQYYEALEKETNALRAARARDEASYVAMKEELAKLQQLEQTHCSVLRDKEIALDELQAIVEKIRKDLDDKGDEIIDLKQMVLTESAAKDKFSEQLDKKDIKLQLMEQELLSLRSSADAGAQVANYVARIEELQKMLEVKTGSLGELQGQLALLHNQVEEKASKEKDYLRALEEKSDVIAKLQGQVLDLTTQLSEVGERSHSAAVTSDPSVLEELRDIVNDMLALCDNEDISFIQGDIDILQHAPALTEDTVASLTSLLRFQYNSISTCAGMVSDITEGANLPLEGREGSLTRVLTSCQSLRRQMFSLEEIIQNNDTAYLQDQIESLQGEVDLLQTEKGDLMSRVDELEGDIDRLNISQTEDSMVKDDMQTRLQKLLQENKTARGLVEALETERDSLVKERDTVAADLQGHIKQLSDLLAAKEEETKKFLQDHEVNLDEMRYKLRHAEGYVQELDKSNQDLAAEHYTLQCEVATLQSALKESEQKQMELSRQLEQQVCDMKLELTDYEVLQVQIKELTLHKQRLEKDNSEFAERYQNLEQRAASKDLEISSLASEREDLQLVVSNLQSVLNESEQRQVELSRQLEQQINDMKLKLTDYEILQTKLKDLTQDKQRLENDISEFSERCENLEQRLASKDMELSVKQDELHEATRKLEAAQLNAPSLQSEVTQLQCRLSSTVAEKTALERELEKQFSAYEHSLASVKDHYDSKLLEVTHLEHLVVELEKAKKEVTETMQREIDQLREELTEGQGAALNTSIELSESFQREREDFQQQLQETSMMHENLEHTLKAEIEELKASLSLQRHLSSTHSAVLHQEKEELTTQLADCKQVINDLAAKIKEEVNTVIELKATVSELQSDKMKAEKEIASYISNLHASNSTSEGLLEKISQLEGELDRAKVVRNTSLHASSAHPVVDYAKRIETLEQMIEERDKDLLAKEQEIKRRTREMDQMKLIINKQVEEIRSIKEQQQLHASMSSATLPRTPASSVKYRRTDDLEGSPGPNGFVVQEHELRRMSVASDRLSKDLIQKEAELRETVALLRRREGELAGLKMSFESVKEEIKSVRQENDKLMEERMTQEQMLRQLSGKIDVLKSSTFNEASRASSSSNVERYVQYCLQCIIAL
ncbi:hypothetical protein EON65_04975 [archaeon]|nr:MAG: hypothetical protein EON65_04975 [archaeon]